MSFLSTKVGLFSELSKFRAVFLDEAQSKAHLASIRTPPDVPVGCLLDEARSAGYTGPEKRQFTITVSSQSFANSLLTEH